MTEYKTSGFGNNEIKYCILGGFILMINKVEIAGVNTAKLPVLSNEEKQELLIKIKNGDIDAREKFINGNLRLVLSVVQRFNGRGENADDLFQIGCVGLIKAIDNFDINQDVQFSTYGVPMIIGEIRRYLRDNNSIRVSRSLRDLAYKVLAIRDREMKVNQREIGIEEIAKELGVPKEDITMCLDAIQEPISLQEPVYGDGNENIFVLDQIKDKKNTDEYWAENITISEAMKKLNDKEKTIIRKRFFDGRTQMEVAEEIGISQAQVSRLEKSAINHIKRIYK
ncbi:MAG: RNA polymerase sporulation sigma factor SigG [Clostridia bacterium]|nr:RNA polymerase sporulation sigma factor SigG [Clostridia bacterium]MBR4260933.1 RNA polymerase sporulation sigma factor SigG [Clostridia bacterium]